MNLSFDIDRISKKYGSQILFENLSFRAVCGSTISITGKNGAGKSTLLKILCNLISPDNGNVKMYIDNVEIEKNDFYKHIGFVSPYLNLYDELTMSEHINFITKLRKESADYNLIKSLSDGLMLKNETKIIKQYSSGMKQKLKYILAMMFKPEILILDEPYTNIDTSSINFIEEYLKEHIKNNALIIASNDLIEQRICNMEIKIG